MHIFQVQKIQMSREAFRNISNQKASMTFKGRNKEAVKNHPDWWRKWPSIYISFFLGATKLSPKRSRWSPCDPKSSRFKVPTPKTFAISSSISSRGWRSDRVTASPFKTTSTRVSQERKFFFLCKRQFSCSGQICGRKSQTNFAGKK